MLENQLKLAWDLIPIELWNTLYMVFCSAFLALIFGLPLGVILSVTAKGHIKENRPLHRLLGFIVNVGRSFPFAILMVALIPLTRWLVGTSLGTTASIVPLTIAAIPFIARIVEGALKEIDGGMIEAAIVMGSTPMQIIYKVMLPEALPTLILGYTTTIINLIGYSAMAGTMGGGGLGKVAIQYGYQRFNPILMLITVLVLIIVVQCIQGAGHWLFKKINRKRRKGFHS